MRAPRHVVVIGGGVAGMQAARDLARQGNRVTLLEAGDELGGQIRYAARSAPDYAQLVRWLRRELVDHGVDLRLSTRATVATVSALRPDAVVVATGVVPPAPPIGLPPDVRRLDVFTALDAADGEWSGRTVILGGDAISCVVACDLGELGVDIHLIAPVPALASEKASPARELLLARFEPLSTVHTHLESTVEAIGSGRATVQRHGERWELDEVGAVIVGGRVADNALYEELLAGDLGCPVRVVGDATGPRFLKEASHGAADVAERLGLELSLAE